MCFPMKFSKFSNFRNLFLRTPSDDCFWIWSVFKQFFTRIPKTWTFRERLVFEIIRIFLLLMSDFYKPWWSQGMLISLVTVRNIDYIDKVFMQAWTLRKLGTFLYYFNIIILFCLLFAYFTKSKETAKLLVRTNLKVLNEVFVINIENIPWKHYVTNRSA